MLLIGSSFNHHKELVGGKPVHATHAVTVTHVAHCWTTVVGQPIHVSTFIISSLEHMQTYRMCPTGLLRINHIHYDADDEYHLRQIASYVALAWWRED